jgi:hypothetical protein
MAGLFWPETRAPLTETEHILAEIGIVVLIFGSVQLWLRANRSALMQIDQPEAGWSVKLHEVPEAQLRALHEAEDRVGSRPEPQIPASEIPGVLETAIQTAAPDGESRQSSPQGVFSREA